MSVLKIKEDKFIIDAPKASFMKRRCNALRSVKTFLRDRKRMDKIKGIKRDADFFPM